MTIRTSQKAIDLIKAYETLRLDAHDVEGNGKLTIGYGHYNDPSIRSSTVITPQQAETYLKADLQTSEALVAQIVKVPLSQNQFDALVSFAFNTGAPATDSVWKAINVGDFPRAMTELAGWRKMGTDVSGGLVARRNDEIELFKTGEAVREYNYVSPVDGKDYRCFAAGTPILMADGTEKPIETIEIGDMVAAFEERDQLQPAKVTHIFKNMAKDVYRLNDRFTSTAEHPFLGEDGKFYPLKDLLEKGIGAVDAAGQPKKIRGVFENNQEIPVFNFTVEKLHTYVAGGFRVHNTSIWHYVENNVDVISLNVSDPNNQKLVFIDKDGVHVELNGRDLNGDGNTDLLSRKETYGKPDGSTFALTLTHDQFDAQNQPVDTPDLKLTLPSATYTTNLIGTMFGSQLGALLGGHGLFEQIGDNDNTPQKLFAA
jgi:GH24 family phage-related lysozyme (muramidase)